MKRLVSLLVAGVAGLAVAGAVANGGAAQQTVTLGSTSGTHPFTNICVDACTYLPFTGVSNPELQVPFDGTVTSFSVNSDSATGTVKLRVLRPAGSGQYTGAGTSAPLSLNIGVNTLAVSLPVRAGDLLGLDNASSALMFDNTSSPTALTAYYELPPLADGITAAPNRPAKPGYRLLMSAVVLSKPTTTTTTSSGPPSISNASLSHKRFRVGKGKTAITAKAKPPRGTTFLFSLSAAAKVQIVITHKVPGRVKGAKCVKPTPKLSGAKHCKRTVTVVTLTRANEPRGADSVPFSGRWDKHRLKPGRYNAVINASNAGGGSQPVTLGFKVVP